jgi:hypothetical protein
MSLLTISQAHLTVQSSAPARPYRGTSFSSLTTIFRSASFAFFDMLRVCCDPQASRFCRVKLRIHDVHCGSSEGLLNDAIGGVCRLQCQAAGERHVVKC